MPPRVPSSKNKLAYKFEPWRKSKRSPGEKGLTTEKILHVANVTIMILDAVGIKSYLVGGVACHLYGVGRVPNDMDLVVLTTLTSEKVKEMIVDANDAFSLQLPRNPNADYRLLWFKDTDIHLKIDVVQPGVMNIPTIPAEQIVRVHTEGTLQFPVMPFLPLLLMKLQAWDDHRTSFKKYLMVKHYVDERDIAELLELSGTYLDTNVVNEVSSILEPMSFLKVAKFRVQHYVMCHPKTAGQWGRLGFVTNRELSINFA